MVICPYFQRRPSRKSQTANSKPSIQPAQNTFSGQVRHELGNGALRWR